MIRGLEVVSFVVGMLLLVCGLVCSGMADSAQHADDDDWARWVVLAGGVLVVVPFVAVIVSCR